MLILLIILVLLLAALGLLTTSGATLGVLWFLAVFGDLIACTFVIIAFVKILRRKK